MEIRTKTKRTEKLEKAKMVLMRTGLGFSIIALSEEDEYKTVRFTFSERELLAILNSSELEVQGQLPLM